MYIHYNINTRSISLHTASLIDKHLP